MNRTLKEKTTKFEKERQQLMERNKELLSKIDQVTGQLEEAQSQCKKQDEELQEFKQNKDLLTQVGKRTRGVCLQKGERQREEVLYCL